MTSPMTDDSNAAATEGTASNKPTEPPPKTPEESSTEPPPPPPKSIFTTIYEAADENSPKEHITATIQGFINESGLEAQYDVFFLYDEFSSINRFTSDRLYSAITRASHAQDKRLFLLLHTTGGRVEPAYLISKCCKKFASRFIVAVPRLAKSAGTLIALGAAEIHMGIISELGPIDPQIGNYPALGLGSAVEHIATLCKKHPDAIEMLAKYLASSLNLHDLGYFERVSESAVQYAERLLSDKPLPENATANAVARKFVYGYKDHGFVIDIDEAKEILGDEIIKFDTPEYQLANRIHEYMENVNIAYKIFKDRRCKIIGTIRDILVSTID
jgi:membrane-bound ClpP family serine protease